MFEYARRPAGQGLHLAAAARDAQTLQAAVAAACVDAAFRPVRRMCVVIVSGARTV